MGSNMVEGINHILFFSFLCKGKGIAAVMFKGITFHWRVETFSTDTFKEPFSSHTSRVMGDLLDEAVVPHLPQGDPDTSVSP